MISLKYIRENPEKVKEICKGKREPDKVDEILELDQKRRAILVEVEKLKSEKNELSKEIGRIMRTDPKKQPI
jgi:seryl-tRNA synthetase